MKKLLRLSPLGLFLFAIFFMGGVFGFASYHFRFFPYSQIMYINATYKEVLGAIFPANKSNFWYYLRTDESQAVKLLEAEKVAPGLTKLVSVEGDFSLAVKVIESDGRVIHHWRIQWQDVFPEAPAYLNPADVPKSQPGTHIHGAQIMDNGDLVFNFEHLALVRLNPCGEVVWTLPFRTHHSIYKDEENNLWVSGQINHEKPMDDFPFIRVPFIEPFVLKVSPKGEILEQKSIVDLVLDNNLVGMLYTTSIVNNEPIVTGDTFHLNDVEVFPDSLSAGFFSPGDIMISLRNINTVLVFDRHWKLKYRFANHVVRQHDPDFVDGNSFTLFDNNNVFTLFDNNKVTTRNRNASSRILVHNAATGDTEILFEGTEKQLFFTNIMGKHQWLSNGNLLVSESRFGRAIEVTPAGERVWEYINLVEPGWLGILEEAERLPLKFDKQFFESTRQMCRSQ